MYRASACYYTICTNHLIKLRQGKLYKACACYCRSVNSVIPLYCSIQGVLISGVDLYYEEYIVTLKKSRLMGLE